MTSFFSRSLLGASFALLAALVFHPGAAFAQVGTCGGQYITGMEKGSCAWTYSTCSANSRVGQAGFGSAECPKNSGDYYQVPSQYCSFDISCQYPYPDITFTSNPASPVVRNSVANLNWSATNATSCTSPDFNTGGATSGSVPMTMPQPSQTFTLNCTNSGQTNSSKTLTVTTYLAPLDGGCTVNPTSAQVGQNVTWTAWASGGQTPYSFEWIGQMLAGLTGTSKTVAYDTVGTKTASIQIKDSNATAASYNVTQLDHQVCNGPIVASNVIGTLEEDGGTQAAMTNAIYNYMEGIYYGAEGWPYEQSYRTTYDAVAANPQNYCIRGRLKQRCNPTPSWDGCNWSFDVDIHSGTSVRAENGTTDQGAYVPNNNGFGQWNQTRFNGSMTAVYSGASTGQTITRSCNASVNVTANAPTAGLSANPVSIIQGQSSTLTWSSTNASQCTSPDFNTGNATSGSVSVSPASTKTYTVTCAGAGGSVNATATVSVTPILGGSCSVAPATASINQAVTWTATPTGGTNIYAYSWSGNDAQTTGSTQSISPSYASPGTKTATVHITSGGQAVDIACSNSLTVTGLPNLTAGSVGPNSATAGTPVSLTALVSNTGNAGTGSGFSVLFQRASDAMGTNAADIGTYANPVVAQGGSNMATRSYTFPAGDGGKTIYVRACADKASAGDAGVINESNEGDNCSAAWTAVSVAYQFPPAVSCVANPSSINAEDTVTFTATPANGATGPYDWKDSDGWTRNGQGASVQRTYSLTGTPPVPPVGGVYQMQVKASNTGWTYCSNQVSINTPYCAGPATVNIDANPTRVKEGQTSTITWSASNVGGTSASCSISGPAGVIATQGASDKASSCTIPGGNSVQTITKQSTFTITCSDGATKSVTVNIIPKFVEF